MLGRGCRSCVTALITRCAHVEGPAAEPGGGRPHCQPAGLCRPCPSLGGPLASGTSAGVDAWEGHGLTGGAEPAAALRFRRKWSLKWWQKVPLGGWWSSRSRKSLM